MIERCNIYVKYNNFSSKLFANSGILGKLAIRSSDSDSEQLIASEMVLSQRRTYNRTQLSLYTHSGID